MGHPAGAGEHRPGVGRDGAGGEALRDLPGGIVVVGDEIMSLYWAIMNQSKNELPFIIDTPFARIDTEHRANITEYFFKKLTGQLLILSTDEELSNNHLEAMRDQISHVYMLEYGQDKRTHIRENQYFEV